MTAFLLLLAVASAQAPADLPVLVDQLVSAVTDGEYTAAADRAQAALDTMGTWATPPAPEHVAALWQVLGAVGIFDHRDDLIVPSLTQACAVDSEHFQARLGPQVQSQWEAACRHVETSASLTVGPLRSESVLWVDGRQATSPLPLAPGHHLVQVLTEGQEPFVAVVDLAAGQAATLDTGLVLPHQPAPGRHAALAGATGASLLTGAALGALAWRAHGVFAEAYDGCDGREPACTASASTIQQTWVQQQRLTVAAGAAGVATLGFGAALAFTW